MDNEAVERLVATAQRGDADSFGAIFDEFASPVYRFVVSRVGRPTDAEDLTQLVFVKAWEALPRYEARGVPFGGWLFRLARNAIIDHVRTQRDQLPLDTAIGREAVDRGPEAAAVLHDDIEAVRVALANLTPDQREVIELRFFAGLSTYETAAAMGRHEGTVRGLQFRAIASLRRALAVERRAFGAEQRPAAELTSLEPLLAPAQAQQ